MEVIGGYCVFIGVFVNVYYLIGFCVLEFFGIE